MGKIAFIFPGQGAQYVGMGKELYDGLEEVKRLFDQANDIIGQDIKRLCFEGPEEELNITENTQPAVLLVSMAAMAALNSNGIYPDMVAGLSLGEYGALVAAGSLTFDEALPLVKKRGRFMQQAVPVGEGTMAAIIGLDPGQVEECCKRASDTGVVEAANYNCPGQIVISGHVAAVKKACEFAKGMGAKRAIVLSVSAPFHSSLLRAAGEGLKEALKSINVKDPKIPLVSNVDAKPVAGAEQIVENLIEQVSSPVRWEESVRYMITQGIDTFIEVGPGKVLNGFLRKISREVKGYNVEDMKSLENTLKGMEA